MKIRLLLLCGSLLLSSISAMATIVDGVRQKPTYQTSGFAVNQEAYLYNVGSGKFFVNGNSFETQASVGETGLLVKFEATGSGDYYFWDYFKNSWYYTFFDNPGANEGKLFVDRNGWGDYYFAVEDNGSTFRLSTSSRNTNYGDYAGAGLYVGLPKTGNTTALDGFKDEDEAYVDWALVSVENYEALATDMAIYNKAQELKEWIDKLNAVNGSASSLESVYLDESSTMDQLQAAIISANSLYIKAVVDNAPDKDNVDLTMALVNPDYEQGEYGWTVEATPGGGANGHQGNVRPGGSATNQCYEAWNNSAFDIYQTLPDMPVGVYEIEVQGFYRYGRDYAWSDYLAQNVDYVKPQGVPVYVYLNNNATNFTNIFADPKQITNESFYSGGSTDYNSQSKEGTTYYFPNGMASAAIAFSDGMYKQSAYGLIANEGDAFRIGVKGNSSQLGDSWVIWDNFKLYYRGFKAEVVQPILETAMADLNQYAGLLMGKTEYATLSKALSDAQTAIDNQNGENMFKALNDLYNVKESVIASKDLFLEQEVSTNLADLQTAIANAANEKMSAATRNVATTLEAGIRGNTLYEGTQIEQLKNDVSAAISGLQNSPVLYTMLNGAISDLEAATALKASQALLSEANTLIGTAKTGYNEGSIADSEVDEWMGTLGTKTSAIQTSATAYTNLNNAITSLQTAAQKKAAKTWLDQASEKLTQAQEGYQAGSLSDEAAETLTSSMNALVVNINTSAEAYATLDTAIKNLEAAIATASTDEARVAKSTVTKANLRLNKSKEFYNEGTIADADIPARVASHEQLITDLTYSINLYKDFKEALDNLNTALTTTAQTPMSTATRTAAQNVYNTAFAAYEAGTVDDDKIAEQKTALNAQITAINNSVALYATLVTPLADLETALQQKAAQGVISTATTVFNDASAAYTDGNIADADVASTITSINAQTSALNTSAGLYAQLNTALGNFQTAITAAQEAGASVTMITNANSLKAGYQSGYDNGSEENVPAALTAISNAIANLGAAAPLYPQANNLNTKLADLATELGKADDAIAEAEDALEQYLSSELRSGLETALDDLKAKVNVAKTNKSTMADDLAGYQLDLTNSESTLGEDHADLYADMGTAFNTMSGDIDNLISSLGLLRTDLEGVTENAVAESANKVEIAHNIATFCSMMDLDFTRVEEVRAYIVSAFTPSTGDAILTRVYDVPKGTGVVLIGDNGSYEIPAGTGATVVSNLLVGVNRATELHQVDGDYTNFILTNGESGEGFYPVEDGSTLAAGKAYLPLPTASLPASGIGNGAAIRFVFEDSGEATFIDSVGFDYAGSKMEKGVYYNLNGQRVERPVTGGIYILDGKKILVK